MAKAYVVCVWAVCGVDEAEWAVCGMEYVAGSGGEWRAREASDGRGVESHCVQGDGDGMGKVEGGCKCAG